MALDKYATDTDYVKVVKDEYAKIDKEMYDEEMSIAVPDTLTKQIANQLLSEKEALLTNVYQQIR